MAKKAPWQLKRLYSANLKAVFETHAKIELFYGLLSMTARLHPQENRWLWAGTEEEMKEIDSFCMRFNNLVHTIRLVTERRKELWRSIYYHERQWEDASARGDYFAAAYHAGAAQQYKELANMSGKELRAMFAKAIMMARYFDMHIAPKILYVVEGIPPWAAEEVLRYIDFMKRAYGALPEEARQLEDLPDEALSEEAKLETGKELTTELAAELARLEELFQQLSEAQWALMEEIQRLKEEIDRLIALQKTQIAQGFLGLAAQTATQILNLQAQLDDAYRQLSQLQERTTEVWDRIQELRR